MPGIELSEEKLISRIAFGSCAGSDRDDAIFATISNTNADVFLFIGDNVYAANEEDDAELKSLKQAYGQLAGSKAFADLRRKIPLLVTWDDHDYGLNDAGGDWPRKLASQQLYNHVWAIKASDPRASRDGVYFSRTAGPEGKRVQFILLDTRFFRSPLRRLPKPVTHGRYAPLRSADQSMLGEAQWAWLEAQLRKPADVRVIATSIQLLANGHNWEAWLLFPRERDRFFSILKATGAKGVVLISGDRHSAAIYRETEKVPYPLWEVTSSSLNLPLSSFVKNIQTESDPNRIGEPYYDANFGIIDIDWQARRLLLQVRDDQGRTVLASSVLIDDLD